MRSTKKTPVPGFLPLIALVAFLAAPSARAGAVCNTLTTVAVVVGGLGGAVAANELYEKVAGRSPGADGRTLEVTLTGAVVGVGIVGAPVFLFCPSDSGSSTGQVAQAKPAPRKLVQRIETKPLEPSRVSVQKVGFNRTEDGRGGTVSVGGSFSFF